jgi:hypothetical protein
LENLVREPSFKLTTTSYWNENLTKTSVAESAPAARKKKSWCFLQQGEIMYAGEGRKIVLRKCIKIVHCTQKKEEK